MSMKENENFMRALKCRECGREYPLTATHVCEFDFGPLEVVYDYERIKASLTRAAIQSRPNSMWRYRELLPVAEGPTVGLQAGFTPLEAIHIATANGAEFLGEGDKIGTLAAGKQADLVVIDGDPSGNIKDIEKVETVFKDGVGYDSAKLIESVRGLVGLR